jgi:teichoic acid transport system permease protein
VQESDASQPVRVFKPFKAGFPNLPTYFSEIWLRRSFIHELSLAERRLEHQDTFFGKVWNVLSPIFMAAIYFLLVTVLQGGSKSPNFFIHLLAGVFIFSFISTNATRCAKSITSSGRLITNANFPRAIIPLTQTWSSFLQLIPALVILLLAQIVLGEGLAVSLLYAIPSLLIFLIFATGIGLLLATANVYFRDTSSALPYLNRVWTYASPVLYTADQVRQVTDHDWVVYLNPLFAPVEIWSGTFSNLQTFPLSMWMISIAWSVGFFLVGSAVFLFREGEFAVRV